MAFIIASIDYMMITNLFMQISQIILFVLLGFISYKKFLKGEAKYKFLKYYFIVIIFGLSTWILNILLEHLLDWNKGVQIITYIMNFFFFAFFLYAITKIMKNKNG